MNRPHHLFVAILGLSFVPLLQAAEPLSFDQLNALAIQHHPGSLVVEAELEREDGRLAYQVRLHDVQGTRHDLVLDALSGQLLQDRGRSLGNRLPIGLHAGERAPSWDELNARALLAFPGGQIKEGSLRRMGDGRLLYEVDLDDAEGKEHELVLNALTGELISSRRS